MPVIVGTVVGYILTGRSIPGWLKVLRYFFAWWVLFVFFVQAIALLVQVFREQLMAANGGRIVIQAQPVTVRWLAVLPILLLVAWLVLRRWKRAAVQIPEA